MTYLDKKHFLCSFKHIEKRILHLEKEYAVNPAEPIKEEIIKLTEQANIILRAINSVEDPREKTLLELYYIGEGVKGSRKTYFLWEIGCRLNYSVDWAKKHHAKAIHEIQIPCK